MILRYNNPHPTLAEIVKMTYNGRYCMFHTVSGDIIKTDEVISRDEYLKLLTEMFNNGKLQYLGNVSLQLKNH